MSWVSEEEEKGSRFARKEPGSHNGVCGIVVRWRRMEGRERMERSTPSMIRVPVVGVRVRRRVERRVDFPEPVRPQMEIFWPGLKVRLIFSSAGVPGMWCTVRFWIEMRPWEGHASGASEVSLRRASVGVLFWKVRRREMAPRLVSRRVQPAMNCEREMLNAVA